jgi:competence ComEA-like helix-hairpin-helix protein
VFRGISIKEFRFILALVLAIFAGVLVGSFRSNQPDETVGISSDVKELPAGELLQASLAAAESPRGSVTLGSGGQIDLNAATEAELDALPGIGPAKAAAILGHRDELGGFAAVEELLTVPGIGEATLERLAPYVVVESPRREKAATTALRTPAQTPPPALPTPVQLVRVNYAGLEELQQLHGVGPVLAERIISDRQVNGQYHGPQDLLRVKGIGEKTVQKNMGLMRFD